MDIIEVEIWYKYREQDQIHKHTFETDRSWYRDDDHFDTIMEEDLNDFAPLGVYKKGWKIVNG